MPLAWRVADQVGQGVRHRQLPARRPRGNVAFARDERDRAGRTRRVGEGFVERLVDGQRPARCERGGERLVLELSPERRQVAGFIAEPGVPGLPLPVVFALVFSPIVGGVTLLYAQTLGRALCIRGAGRYALTAALVGGAVALGVVLATDPFPGWRVGAGDRAMIKVAWLGTLLGGAAAGALYMALVGLCHIFAEPVVDRGA